MSTQDLTEEPTIPADLAETVRAAVHAEFDEVLPHVVEALRRNNAFDEIEDRLRAAERRLEARRERPVIVGIYLVLDRIRHLDFDPEVRQAIEDDIVRLLSDAGYEEFAQVGDAYEPTCHDAIEGRAIDGQAFVTKVHSCGLTSFGDTVVRAKVGIAPERPSL